ncbi:MAG: PBP1A family penicillin-binding protein [Ignavibacteriales bacterium]|nr:PBP1A family penicillin-binding protein [Ignavibacteriales bacterium]
MTKRTYSSEDMDRYFNDTSYRHSFLNRGKGFLKRNWKILSIVTVVVLSLLTWYGRYILQGLPSLEAIENPRPALASKVYGEDGAVLDQFAEQNRTRISLSKIPQGLIDALIATEDKDFYTHWGVNLHRFARQMVINVFTFRAYGASTLTQQLARNLYKLQGREESLFDKITRKIREFITSVQIERNFTKQEILELYLNDSFFGRNAYGIESAAQRYFNKSASELAAPEYTLLVGMLQGPNYYDPIKNIERALRRRNIVISAMVHDGRIDVAQADKIKADSLNFRTLEADYRVGIAPHFVEWIRQQMMQKAEAYGFNLERDGLRIYTTLDSRMQRYANKAVDDHLTGFQEKFDKSWDWSKNTEILQSNVDKMIRDLDVYKKARNASIRDSILASLRTNVPFVDSVKKAARQIEVGMVVLDPHNGHIKSMVGGRNFRVFRYGLNHVTQIHRQPGSAFKPFVYTVAIDNGWPVCYEIMNQPVTVPMPDGTRWTPQNFEGNFGGKYTLREALKRSVNLVAVRLMLEMQPTQVVDYAHRMGIKSNVPPYASIALGTAEVSPLELTSAYGVFPNEGVLVDPIAILRIEDKDGNVIEENVPEKKEVLSKETAFLMTNLMEGGVNDEGGTGRVIRTFFSQPAAGKTGTTNDYGDAWFEGFTPHLAAGVWVGFDDNRIKFGSSDGQGGRAAAPIFGRFMRDAYEDPDIGLGFDYFHQPDGIITDTICVLTKKRARSFCPEDTTEIFNSKYPIAPCDVHTSAHWREEKSGNKINW